jgi:hypothetical protein
MREAAELDVSEGLGDAAIDESLLDEEDDLLASLAQAQQETDAGDKPSGVQQQYLLSVLNKIRKEITQSRQPECYRLGTFWMRPKDPLFALNASWIDEAGINPNALYHLPVFIWLPDMLPGAPKKIYCPDCKHHLTRHGQYCIDFAFFDSF